MSAGFFTQRRRAIVLWLMIGAGSLIAHQNCAPMGANLARVQIHNQPQLPLPFDEDPVGFDGATYEKDANATYVAPAKTAKKKSAAKKNAGKKVDYSRTDDEVDPNAGKDQIAEPISESEKRDRKMNGYVPKGLPITVLIDNACAIKECELPGNEKAISCFLLKKSLRADMKELQQSYTTTLPAALTHTQIGDWIHNHPADKQCLKGVSEEREYASLGFNDPGYNAQKAALDLMKFDAAQAVIPFDESSLAVVRVAVIDTGIADLTDLPHVADRFDLRDAVSKGAPGCPAFTNTAPNNSHGTYVASAIGAERGNSIGIAGIANNVDLLAFAIGDCTGKMTTSEISNAIIIALNNKVEVINLSLGGQHGADAGLLSALTQAVNKSVFVVAAAGNSGLDLAAYPFVPATIAPELPGMVSVAALNTAGTDLASFSNFSSDTVTNYVDIAAPGENITVLGTNGTPQGALTNVNGTSLSAPFVTAAAAVAIGYLHQQNLSYSADYVESLITQSGTNTNFSIYSKVKGGHVLDFQKLASSLKGLDPATAVTKPMTVVGQTKWNGTGDTTSVDFTVSWNLGAVHPGARLGLFDSTPGCNFSKPCLLEDLALSGLSGTNTFRIPRNIMAPTMAGKSDPTFPLILTAAIYYKTTNRSSFSLDATAQLNLRTLDRSTATSQLHGRIENIRMDMAYFYVQGWVCLEDSNKTVTVQIEDTSGQVIPTKYSYSYGLMVPHSTPLDIVLRDYGSVQMYNQRDTSNRAEATGISINFQEAPTHEAGLEGHPDTVIQCGTLTAAHGFEFAIPAPTLMTLAGRGFKVKATLNGKSMYVASAEGRTTFEFPTPNHQPALGQTIGLSRGPAGLDRVAGSICSNSPSPVSYEIYFTTRQFVDATFRGIWPFEDHVNEGGFVNDANVTARQINLVDPKYRSHFDNINGYTETWDGVSIVERTITDLENTIFKDPFYDDKGHLIHPKETAAEFYDSLPYPPNTSLFCHYPNKDWENYVNSHFALRSVRTGLPLFFRCQDASDPEDPQYKLEYAKSVDAVRNSTVNRIPPGQHRNPLFLVIPGEQMSSYDSSSRDIAQYWDYYDVGIPFSDNLVGYTYDPSTEVGAYLQQTYTVKTLLREVKKYETPLSMNSVILRTASTNVDPNLCGDSRFRFNIDETVKVLPPHIAQLIKGFDVVGHDVVKIDVPGGIQRVPITIRAYQDGRLILNLESDFGTRFYNIPYSFHRATY